MVRLILSCALLCFHAPAFAQAGDAVLVNATRFPQAAATLPASVSVIGAEDIARSGARTLPELLGEQAGIATRELFGNNAANTSVDMRGFGVTGTQNTLILVDGVRVTDIDLDGVQWSAIPLSSIERIEVLRGTGAVLYGEGASAGVINVITRSPQKQGTYADALGRAGSYNTGEARVGAGYASDSFAINGTIYRYASDGYRANNRNEQENSALGVRWSATGTTLDLRAGTDRRDLRLPGARRIQPSIALDEYGADPRGAQTPLDYASRDGVRGGATLMHRRGAAEFTLGADYRSKDQRSYFDQGGFPASRAEELEFRALSPRARVAFATGALRHSVTFGADLQDWRLDSRRSPRPEHLGQPLNRVSVTRENRAFYAQDAMQIGATQLLVGARGERARYEARDTLDAGAPGFFFSAAALAVMEAQKQHAWELGLRHALTPQWSAFARAGRSYRLVNVDEIYENDAFFAPQFQLLRPQHALTREAGAAWRSGPTAVRATLFRTEVTDEIHLDPFSTGVGNTNLPPSRRTGLELDAQWQAAESLRLSLAYAWTDARFRRGTMPGSAFAIGTNLEIAGRRVPLVPEHKLNLGAAWDIGARTRASATLAALSSQFMDNDEPNTLGVRIPRHAIVDLKLSHELGWGRIAFALNNAFDGKYYNYAVRSAFVVDRYAVYPLARRTFAATLEARFD